MFGAGAMGSFFGGMLAARNEVTLVGRRDHMEAIRDHGLRITGKTSRVAMPIARTKVPRGPSPDLVLVTTKAYDTEAAMTVLKDFAEGALFASLQNGLDNGDDIARTARRVTVGTTAHGVTYLGPGEIRHAGLGDTVLGRWKGASEDDVVRLRDVFDDAGIRSRIASDIRSELWSKLVVNASINPIAALAGCPNGRLVSDPRLREAVERTCREAAKVAKGEGARIDPEDVVRRTLVIARRTGTNRCSMLQDLDAGHRTEIDAITGAVLRGARRRGIPVPMNDALYALVRAREAAGPRQRAVRDLE